MAGKEYWWITGSSSGIGKAIAELALGRKNAIVTGIARHQTIFHPNYHHFSIDLSVSENVNQFAFISEGNPDTLILINNAGTLGEVEYAGKLADSLIKQAYHLNIVSAHILINQFIKTYKDQKAKKIILNVSSGAATNAYDGWSVYCATKAALDMMSACIAKEQEKVEKGLRFQIHSIAPGVVNTKMQDQIRKVNEDSFSRKSKFIELYEKQELIDPRVAAQKYIDVVDATKP